MELSQGLVQKYRGGGGGGPEHLEVWLIKKKKKKNMAHPLPSAQK